MQLQPNRSKGVHQIYLSLCRTILISIVAFIPIAQTSSLFARAQNELLYQTEASITPELVETAQTAVAQVANRIKPARTTTTASELLDNGLLEADNAEEVIPNEELAPTTSETDVTDVTQPGEVEADPEPSESSASNVTSTVDANTDAPESDSVDDTEVGVVEPAITEEGERTPINVEEVDVNSYNNDGISVYVPAEWDVSTDSLDSIFQIAIPGEFFFGFIQSFDNNDFPGALAVVIMQHQAEAFVKQIDQAAELVGVEIFTTDQRLPVVKITLTTQIEGIDATGALYVIAPGENAYMLIALTSSNNWPIITPGVDLIAQSMFFNGELISVTAAEGDAFAYTDTAGNLTVTVPEDWQVSETGDEDLPVLLLDPSYQFATSIGLPSQFPTDVDVNELVGLAKEGQADELTNLIISGLDLTSDDFVLDEQQTDTFTLETGFAIRLVGMINLGDDVQMPTLIHFGILNDTLIGAVTFGQFETILAQEESILAILNSVVVAE